MSLLEQIEQNPLLLDSEEVRGQVRNFTEGDYNKAWNLYTLAKAKQTRTAKGLQTRTAKGLMTDTPRPSFLLSDLVAWSVIRWCPPIICLAVAHSRQLVRLFAYTFSCPAFAAFNSVATASGSDDPGG